MKNKRQTAEEVMAELNADPAFVAAQRTRDETLGKLWAERARIVAPLVAAIRAKGFNIDGVGDLRAERFSYPELIPLLIEHARDESYPMPIRETIIRALGTPDALGHWDELVDFFVNNSLHLAPEDRHITAFAVAEAADDSKLDEVIRLIKNTRFGDDRIPLLVALIQSKNPKARMTLMELQTDPDLGLEIKRLRRIERLQKR